jgi:hypothetical protein
MRRFFLLLVGLVWTAGCTPTPDLTPGRWTGTLTPMNHPDMRTPVAYDVRHADGALALDVVVSADTHLPARELRLSADSLFFVFDEPDAGVPLACAWGRDGAGFAGRCTDASGKWARFTMQPPEHASSDRS